MSSRDLVDDRSTAARIRDAAITCFAADGVAATSVRTIAAEAGVSAGLVIHHFGSKDDLRVACDQHVARLIREVKASALTAGPAYDPLAELRTFTGGPPLTRYLARTLVDGSPHVAELVDEMVNDAVEYMEAGVASGMLKPSDYPRERAALLAMWRLGALVLHEHLERLIGVDIASDFSDDPAMMRAYFGPALELMSGIITDTTRDRVLGALLGDPEATKETA